MQPGALPAKDSSLLSDVALAATRPAAAVVNVYRCHTKSYVIEEGNEITKCKRVAVCEAVSVRCKWWGIEHRKASCVRSASITKVV